MHYKHLACCILTADRESFLWPRRLLESSRSWAHGLLVSRILACFGSLLRELEGGQEIPQGHREDLVRDGTSTMHHQVIILNDSGRGEASPAHAEGRFRILLDLPDATTCAKNREGVPLVSSTS